MKKIFFTFLLLFCAGITALDLHARVYGGLVLQSDSGPTVIALCDYHRSINNQESDTQVFSADGKYNFYIKQKELDVVCKQQQEIFDLVQKLHNGRVTVEVFVEDMPSTIKKYYPNVPQSVGVTRTDIEKASPVWQSPLIFIEESFHAKNIPCTNVEFRFTHDMQTIKNAVENVLAQTDVKIVQMLNVLYNDASFAGKKNIALDAHIINQIKKSNKDVVIVLAGGTHIASVAKVLYKLFGYTSAKVIVPDSLDKARKDRLANLDEVTLSREKLGTAGFPPYLENLSQAVVTGLENSEQKQSIKNTVAKGYVKSFLFVADIIAKLYGLFSFF